jgi:hypothetical protein
MELLHQQDALRSRRSLASFPCPNGLAAVFAFKADGGSELIAGHVETFAEAADLALGQFGASLSKKFMPLFRIRWFRLPPIR